MSDGLACAKAAAPQVLLFSDEEWAEIVEALSLPPQQRRIVALVLDGREDKQIAQHLDIAIPTVRTHLTRICSRLGVSGRAELMLRVFQEFRRGCQDCPRRRHPCHRK